MMTVVLLFLLLAYLFIQAVIDVKDVNRLKGEKIQEDTRLRFYREAMLWLWVPALLVLFLCALPFLSLADLGIKGVTLTGGTWFIAVSLTANGGLLLLTLYQVIAYFTSPSYREQAKAAFADSASKSHYDAVMNNVMIPRSKKEKRLFFGVALSAGVCEELLWRGLLYFLLRTLFPGLSVLLIMITASLIFGLGHSYQGFRGIGKTTLAGGILGCLYLTTGSIIPGMFLHFCIDFASAFIY